MNGQHQIEYRGALAHLCTPDDSPWTDRRYQTESEADPRPAFERDRDRLIHSEHFRRLQHKTQVLIVTEGDLYSTRLLHSVETAQIGRSLACSLGLNGALADAICLAHDVGTHLSATRARRRSSVCSPTTGAGIRTITRSASSTRSRRSTRPSSA